VKRLAQELLHLQRGERSEMRIENRSATDDELLCRVQALHPTTDLDAADGGQVQVEQDEIKRSAGRE
jgi:hypothetical protein